MCRVSFFLCLSIFISPFISVCSAVYGQIVHVCTFYQKFLKLLRSQKKICQLRNFFLSNGFAYVLIVVFKKYGYKKYLNNSNWFVKVLINKWGNLVFLPNISLNWIIYSLILATSSFLIKQIIWHYLLKNSTLWTKKTKKKLCV